jgi:signal transduction histidine kinase
MARQQLLNQRQHKRLARKIHDEVSQKLTLMALQMSLVSENNQPASWSLNCKEWSQIVIDLGHSVREITNELQPRILDEFGLAAALQWFAQAVSKDIACAYRMPQEDILLPPFAANELFGVCREIVMEILVPHRVPQVELETEQTEGLLRLHIRAHDNNEASDRVTESSLDSLAIHERLLCLDGTAELNWAPESGSTITLSLPAHRDALCPQPVG